MEFRNLRALVEVSRCGGFSAAAKVIGTTQSTISKAILQLEHDCGARLLERLGRGIRLTDAGEVVVRRAANMLDERDRLLSELGELKGLQRGKLKLGLPFMVSGVLFAKFVAAYRKRYPEIELELEERGIRLLEADVLAGRIEVGASLLPVSEEFEYRILREEPLFALLPAEHPLSGRTSIKLEDLASDPTILFEEGFALNTLISAAYRRRKLPINEAGRSGNPDFLLAMVAAGLGVAFLPRVIIATRESRSVRAVLLDEEDMWWRMALIWRRGGDLSPPARRWLEMVAPHLRAGERHKSNSNLE